MSIPDFQSLMLPVLMALKDGEETPVSKVRERVAESEGLTDDQQREMIPSGSQPLFVNRISWAMSYLRSAELLKSIRRGVWQLTEEGKSHLDKKPSRVDRNYLSKYCKAFAAADSSSRPARTPLDDSKNTLDAKLKECLEKNTWDEILEEVALRMRKEMEIQVLARVQEAPPEVLERVVVKLLIAMRYGGGDPKMGKETRRSKDGGIDGIIKEDALGLDKVCVQTKRYTRDRTVGEADLRDFAGAMDSEGMTKGVFVTTASFTTTAVDFVERIKSAKRIVLIDGRKLARLMVRHNIGVCEKDLPEIEIKIKQLDEDYFTEE